ncbi:hypothetical protein [Sphingomonas yabuuchiae]|uniref:Uncharacterized protein n=1 Tax=Sphingomonas yabuuchiae TaxID=172044 RepID=A0ABR6K5B5_9SPHN|nr:hypothetical protein [Sphingomonas yabuuchiae]
MKVLVLSHLNVNDRTSVVQALDTTLDALPGLSRSCTGWGDRGRRFMQFQHPRRGGPFDVGIHFTVEATQTMLRYQTVVD